MPKLWALAFRKAFKDLNTAKQREQALKHYYANKAAYIKRSAVWKKNNPKRHAEILRKYWLKKTYGLTVQQYDNILAEQNNSCAICEVEHTEEKRLAVDHNHDTGEVRGLLCYDCNRNLIGNRTEPGIFIKAANYLSGFAGKAQKI